MDLSSKLLTVKEVLEITGISRHTLYRDTKSGIIEAIKFGKSVRYEEADVMKYAKEKKECVQVKAQRRKEVG